MEIVDEINNLCNDVGSVVGIMSLVSAMNHAPLSLAWTTTNRL